MCGTIVVDREDGALARVFRRCLNVGSHAFIRWPAVTRTPPLWTRHCQSVNATSGRAALRLPDCGFHVLLRGELSIHALVADFVWCPVAECGMNSAPMVEQFDIPCNILLR